MRSLAPVSGKHPLSQDAPQNAPVGAPARLRGRGVYAITDGPRPGLMTDVEATLGAGTRLLQYRDKTRDHARRLREARALAERCHRHGALLIINDDVDLAAACGADGVHLGEDDPAPASARRQLGADTLIGVSCYNNLERARRLAAAGADYLAFGAFFPSPTKPHARKADPALLRAARRLGPPLVAIGGITPDNGHELVTAGADFLAVISAVFGAPDVARATRAFHPLFNPPHFDPPTDMS